MNNLDTLAVAQMFERALRHHLRVRQWMNTQSDIEAYVESAIDLLDAIGAIESGYVRKISELRNLLTDIQDKLLEELNGN